MPVRCLLLCSFCLFISNFFRFALLLLLLCILNSQRRRVVIVSSFMRTTCVCVCAYAICTKMCVRYMLQMCTEALFGRVQINRVSGCWISLLLPACCCALVVALFSICAILRFYDSAAIFFRFYLYIHFPLLSPLCSVLSAQSVLMGARIIFFPLQLPLFFLPPFLRCVWLLYCLLFVHTHRRARALCLPRMNGSSSNTKTLDTFKATAAAVAVADTSYNRPRE